MDEWLTLLEKEIPAGRQALLDSHHNLQKVASYCDHRYVEVIVTCDNIFSITSTFMVRQRLRLRDHNICFFGLFYYPFTLRSCIRA